jgi:hypothetical protein
VVLEFFVAASEKTLLINNNLPERLAWYKRGASLAFGKQTWIPAKSMRG